MTIDHHAWGHEVCTLCAVVGDERVKDGVKQRWNGWRWVKGGGIDREAGLRMVAAGLVPYCEEHGVKMFWEEGLVAGHWECRRCLEPSYDEGAE